MLTRKSSFQFIYKKCIVLGLMFGLLLAFSSCKKYTTPRKTERIIQKDSWQINSFFLSEQYLGDLFEDKGMTFEEDGTVLVKGEEDIAGQWSVGLNKNPANLFLSNFNGEPLFFLNNDWEVTSLTKKSFTLESDGNTIVFNKIE